MNAKISLFVISVEVIIYLLLYNLHDRTFKVIQIGDYEIKIVNFADDSTIFLIDITCLNWMQKILKLY